MTKRGELPPGSRLKEGFAQLWYSGICVCGKEMMRKDGKKVSLEAEGRGGNAALQLSLELGSTQCMNRRVFHISSLFR